MTDQYATIASSTGWTDRRARGRLQIDGADTRTFLQALVSNDLTTLADGRGVYATYLTPQGRLIADLRIYDLGSSLLIDVAPGVAAGLASKLDGSIFAEDVRIADVSSAIDQLGVIGTDADDVVADVLGVELEEVSALATLSHLAAGDLRAVRTDDAPVPSFDLFFPAEIRDRVLTRLGESGARPLAPEVAEGLRILAGRPLFGVDMTVDTIPLEAGLLERAISTSKGCYVGQEVIIRVLHRGGGRVAKRLARLRFDGSAGDVPIAGTPLTVNGAEIGRVTSAAPDPAGGGVVALGYVHRDHTAAGTRVVAAGSTERAGEVVGLAG